MNMHPENVSQTPLTISGEGYINGKPLFSGLEMKLMRGDWTCLLGTSGVGKTSVLRAIAGLETKVKFSGRFPDFSGKVAFMAQDDLLFPWLTAVENVCLGQRLRGERRGQSQAVSVLERVGLSAHLHKKPACLSGGQRQRVALARTLMEGRSIVLLDEPFSALDAQTRNEMQELAVEILADKTVLMVTHDAAETARLAARIYVMSREETTLVSVPTSPAPRSFDDPQALNCQSQILQLLRKDGK